MMRLLAVIVLVSTLGLASGAPAGASADDRALPARAGHDYPDFETAPSDPAVLRNAWRRWQRLDPSAYRLQVHNSCFCVERPPLVTTVANDEVTSVRYQGGTRDLRRKGYDMDRMFLILRDAYANADLIDVRYSERGVPYRIRIDWSFMIADEEAYYTVKVRGLDG